MELLLRGSRQTSTRTARRQLKGRHRRLSDHFNRRCEAIDRAFPSGLLFVNDPRFISLRVFGCIEKTLPVPAIRPSNREQGFLWKGFNRPIRGWLREADISFVTGTYRWGMSFRFRSDSDTHEKSVEREICEIYFFH